MLSKKGVVMIKLYGFGAAFNMVDASPFVVKVDFFLRLSGLDYQFIGDVNNLRKSPKEKLPYIDDDGEKVADSSIIIEYLTEKYQLSLDQHLTEQQKAQAYLYKKAIEESLYWCLVYSRWVSDDTWPIIKQRLFGNLPVLVNWLVPNIIRKGVKKSLYNQGYGRHSKQMLLTIAEQHLSALSTLLAEQDYFFGEQITSFDVTAYAFIAEMISVDFSNDFNNKAHQFDNLVSYCQRIEQKYYS